MLQTVKKKRFKWGRKRPRNNLESLRLWRASMIVPESPRYWPLLRNQYENEAWRLFLQKGLLKRPHPQMGVCNFTQHCIQSWKYERTHNSPFFYYFRRVWRPEIISVHSSWHPTFAIWHEQIQRRNRWSWGWWWRWRHQRWCWWWNSKASKKSDQRVFGSGPTPNPAKCLTPNERK